MGRSAFWQADGGCLVAAPGDGSCLVLVRRVAGAWQGAFAAHGIAAAQLLLTLEDSEDRRRYLNARATLSTLLGLGWNFEQVLTALVLPAALATAAVLLKGLVSHADAG